MDAYPEITLSQVVGKVTTVWACNFEFSITTDPLTHTVEQTVMPYVASTTYNAPSFTKDCETEGWCQLCTVTSEFYVVYNDGIEDTSTQVRDSNFSNAYITISIGEDMRAWYDYKVYFRVTNSDANFQEDLLFLDITFESYCSNDLDAVTFTNFPVYETPPTVYTRTQTSADN
jgi:hypothetical protein